ncbi:MAG: flippase [Armatimonadetes bacterium]|nr:flippase [Armatimonadota bacterium]
MSNDARSAVKNSFASITAQLANLLVGLASSVYVARMLGKEQFGIYNWALGLCGLVVAVANVGVDNVISRETAKERTRASEYLISGFLIKVFTSTIAYLGIVLYLKLRNYSGLQLAVGYLLCTTVITESFNASCRAVLIGIERQDASAVISVVTNLIRVSLVILLVTLKYDILAVAWVTVGILILALILHLRVISRLAGGTWKPKLATTKYLLATGSTFLITSLFASLFDRADYVILEYYKDIGTVGIYGAAWRMVEIVTMIAYNASIALFPILSRRFQTSKEEHAKALEKATKYMTVFGFPFTVGILLLSNPLMVGLYGKKFAESGTALAILMWSRVFAFPILPGQQSVAARNAQLKLFPPVVVRAILAVGLAVYLIPKYDYKGAAVSKVVAENVHYILCYLIAFSGPERFNPIKLFGKPALATAVMAVAILFLRRFGIFVATGGAVVVYIGAIQLFRVLDSEDVKILRKVAMSFIRPGLSVKGD